MSIIGETLLSVSIKTLIKKLSSEGLRLFTRQEQIEADLMKWKKILLKIKAVLEDADDKQTTEQSVKIWLGQLRNLAYDVEDILDEFETETLRRKLLLEPQAQPSTSKLWKVIIPTCCDNFNPKTIKFDVVMVSKIKDITTRLEDISAQKDQLELKENSGGKSTMVRERLPETSLVNEAKVYGREKDKEAIVELLLKDDLNSDDGFSVIPILGMGGLGKTTVAQLVYNDQTVESHFDFKAWTCVSEDFDVVRITKTILRSIDDGAGDVNDLNLLQETLKSKLDGKKFLFVLDDIWNENPNDWELLSRPFQFGSRGSKIIITTRNEGVSAMATTGKVHLLGLLSNDDCLRIFAQHSLRRTDFSVHQDLKEIGEKIVKRCNGLPLAAKTLGGLLRGKYNLRDWKKVLNSKMWDLPEEKSDIMRALKVSYYYLPAHLKQCFAYCSLLPKDYKFCLRDIVLLWMAEGLLQPDHTGEKKEEIGHHYFHELQSRSFFQQSSTDASQFVMHDLINDLAQWAAQEIYLRMEDATESNRQQKFSNNLRHLSYISGQYDGIKRFETISDAEHLRTFLPIMLSDDTNCYLAYNVIHTLLKLQHLRVLSLRGYRISQLPNSIGELKYLRHLDLSETNIKALPESVNSLYNLLTLRVESCRLLKKLCSNMGNLIKLRHLHNSNVYSLAEMPLGVGKLTCLQTLCSFVVGKDTGSGLQELKSLTHLKETLEISKLENVKNLDDAKEAEMNCKNLKVLFLKWSDTNGNSGKAELATRVLDTLKPHQNLEEFSISGYGGTSFPIWLGDSSFSNLVLLRFEGCGLCISLPSVGKLPSLKHLFISLMASVKRVASEFHGYGCSLSFPSLETLCFEDMQEWEDWIPRCGQEDETGFPHLRELRIVRCSKLLGRLPERLPSLEMLVIRRCEQLQLSLPSLPSLCKLEVDGCKEVALRSSIDLSSLNSVSLSDISNRVFLTGIAEQELPKVKELEIKGCKELTYLWQNEIRLLQHISSLHRLIIASCPQLLSLVAEEEEHQKQQGLPDSTIHSLELSYCQRLAKLPQALLSLSSLAELHIIGCDELISCPEADLPSQLRTIEIRGCILLASLPQSWMDKTTPLQSLYVSSCNSLTYIARVQLPPSLKQLSIVDCNDLKNLIYEDQISVIDEKEISIGSSTCLLESLHIGSCSSLTSVWSKNELPATLEQLEVTRCSNLAFLSKRSSLPTALKYLLLFECSKLESIAESLDDNTRLETMNIWSCKNLKFLPNGLHKLRHLQKVFIWGCSNLVSFPEGGLSSPKLTELYISGCEKLEALPDCMHSLTSLQHLTLADCPSIVSFLEHGFPSNLPSLVIGELKICEPVLESGMHRFTSLRQLTISIGWPELVSFLPENTGMRLPVSLAQLSIQNFPNLERLSSISETLPSLESLDLFNCPKLKSFPENGLPASLLSLSICDCPLLQERCKKNGEYWFMITRNIPCVFINLLQVFYDSS
ncbi:Disease resistance protein [Melia azedarach]|uniref:Disease resistance protein n=1 Tax=Melia azedarach TaxID=155640 RepID=A0ACC1X0K9_MELAZ|nr:Disease resistance protein [Melia azedarach]